jgi:ABC-type spermidine/putrescine transport system permease subunit II
VRTRAADGLLWLVLIATLAFLLLPLFVVVPMSFNPKDYDIFPPTGLSLRWYADFFGSSTWLGALWLSVQVAVLTALLATLLGLTASIALVRRLIRGRTALRTLLLAPLIVPTILTAIATFDLFSRLHLVDTTLGLVLGHTILALPFTTVILTVALQGVNVDLEAAAMSLGASPLRAFLSVTVPNIAPSLVGALLFAFIASWDEVVMALFLTNDQPTLPVYMFSFLSTQIRPTIAAVSTLLLVLALIGVGLYGLAARSLKRRSAKRYKRYEHRLTVPRALA